MMDTIFVIGLYGGIILLIHKLVNHYRYHRSDIKYFRIYSGVHDLEQITQQLEQLEEIQTSIELAKYHKLKGVTIELPDSLGHDHGHTLLINGHDKNSKALMNVVIEERDRLRDILTKKISELERHGTTQLRPDLVVKELAEVSTMRTRGAHFSPLPHKKSKHRQGAIKRDNISLNDYAFLVDSDQEGSADE